jgi:hypothetical protein
MVWPFASSKRQASRQPRYFKPGLMRLEDREVLSAADGMSLPQPTIVPNPVESILPAITNEICALQNSFQAVLNSFTAEIATLNQEIALLQNGNNYLWQALQQLEHTSPTPTPPGNPPTSPPATTLSAFAGTYSATQVPTGLQGDIPTGYPQHVSFTLNADGSGLVSLSPFDGKPLSLHFNSGSISYDAGGGTIGFTYPSGLVSYVQFAFRPTGDHQLTGSLAAHGDWGQGGSFVAFSFPNITLTAG